MKIIESKVPIKYDIGFLRKIEGDRIPTHELNLSEGFDMRMGFELRNEFNQNRIVIIETLNEIENTFNAIICKYFFGKNEHGEGRRQEFEELIITHPWFSFEMKKRIMNKILIDLNYLNKQERKDYNRILDNLQETRNLFAHGHLFLFKLNILISRTNSAKDAILINDKYLEKIEKDISTCYDITESIFKLIGAGSYRIK